MSSTRSISTKTVVRAFIAAFLIIASPSWSQTVTRDGKQWLQPIFFAAGSTISWNVLNELCPRPARECSGEFSEIDLSGYVWASEAEVTELFSSYDIPLPSDGTTIEAEWPEEFFADVSSLELSGALRFLGGWVRDELYFAGLKPATALYVIDAFTSSSAEVPPGSILSDEAGSSFSNTRDDDRFVHEFSGTETPTYFPAGAWLWRTADVPPPEVLTSLQPEALASCGFIRSAENDVVNRDLVATSCDILDSSVRARAENATAELRLFADTAERDQVQATGYVGDLVTIVDGFDQDGIASGTLELDVEGELELNQLDSETNIRFFTTVWAVDEDGPVCNPSRSLCDVPSTLGYSEILFGSDAQSSNFGGVIATTNGGLGDILSDVPGDLQATISVPWTVTRDNPSFYFSLHGVASVYQEGAVADFFNTAKARLSGPDGFEYSGKNGFAQDSTNAQTADSEVDITGAVKSTGGADVCAMVLASGQFMFSCDPRGQYALNDLPREPDGTVVRQVYANGFFPSVETVRGSVHEEVLLRPARNCPNYNAGSNSGDFSGEPGKLVTISGRVLLQNSENPVCALVLANGQHIFSCDELGSYELEFPLDANGQYTLQVYASGFAPSVQTFGEMGTPGDVRVARAAECR